MQSIKLLTCIISSAFLPVFQAGAESPDATKLFKTTEPSVVLITDEEGGGSGVVISADGMILTNYHVANTPLPMTVEAIVVEGGKSVKKSFPNAKLSKVHIRNDLALVKVDAPGATFKPARLSKSDNDTEAGGTCFALGFPFLPEQNKPVITITKGIVSSVKRMVNGIPYIQLDAAINPGNSGGALINDKGVLIGIPTLRFEGADRIGMATPVAEIKMDQFVDPKDRKGDPAEALRLSNITAALYTRDVFSLGTDDEAVAIAVYLQRQALALEPNNSAWSLSLASLYWRLQKYPLARAYAENAIRLDPGNLRARMLLADVFSALKEPVKAARQRMDCLPLLSEKTPEDTKKSLFDKLADEFMASGDAVRSLYIVSWARAGSNSEPSPGQRLVMQSAAKTVAEPLIREIMDKTGGHSIEDMAAMVRKAGVSGTPDKVAKPSEPDVTPVEDPNKPESKVVKVDFKSGATVTMVDAPAGVVFDVEKGTLKWTPQPFSKSSEVRVLFVLKSPDGSEELQVHTISR